MVWGLGYYILYKNGGKCGNTLSSFTSLLRYTRISPHHRIKPLLLLLPPPLEHHTALIPATTTITTTTHMTNRWKKRKSRWLGF